MKTIYYSKKNFKIKVSVSHSFENKLIHMLNQNLCVWRKYCVRIGKGFFSSFVSCFLIQMEKFLMLVRFVQFDEKCNFSGTEHIFVIKHQSHFFVFTPDTPRCKILSVKSISRYTLISQRIWLKLVRTRVFKPNAVLF